MYPTTCLAVKLVLALEFISFVGAQNMNGCKAIAMALLTAGVLGRGLAHQQAPPRQDETETTALALLDRAIQAMGGADALGKAQIATAKVKAAFNFPNDRTIPVVFTGSIQGFDRFRLDLEILQNNPFPATLIVNGSDDWIKAGTGNPKRLEALKGILFDAGLKHDLYSLQLAQLLLPMRDKTFKLSATGEIKVGDRPALGFNVVHAGRPDVNIYLDKQTVLPVKCESRVRVDKTNEEFAHNIFLADYKIVDGVKCYTRFTIHRDDRKIFDGELTEIEHMEKLDAKTFTEP
jgi:hypothetical protein